MCLILIFIRILSGLSIASLDVPNSTSFWLIFSKCLQDIGICLSFLNFGTILNNILLFVHFFFFFYLHRSYDQELNLQLFLSEN